MGALSMLNPMNAVDGVQDKRQQLKWDDWMQKEKEPFNKSKEGLEELVRDGIPDDLRAKVWFEFSGGAAKKAAAPDGHYAHLLEVKHTLNFCVNMAGTEGW